MRRLWVVPLYTALALGVLGLGGYLAVALLVEHGREVQVPDLRGSTLSEALDQVSPLGLDLEVRAFTFSDDVPENRIVRQSPQPERVVKEGRAVGVTVSRGPERHATPDVRGLALEDARIYLGEAQLQPQVVIRLPDGPAGYVLAVGREPGGRVPQGEAIPLLVSSGPRPLRLRMPRLEGGAIAEALAKLDELDLRIARIEEVSLEDPERRGRVVGQEPLPGFPVTAGQQVVLTVAGRAVLGDEALGVYVSHALPAGFARRRVELTVRDRDRIWHYGDEWVPGGSLLQRWVVAPVGARIELRVDGEPAYTNEGDYR